MKKVQVNRAVVRVEAGEVGSGVAAVVAVAVGHREVEIRIRVDSLMMLNSWKKKWRYVFSESAKSV